PQYLMNAMLLPARAVAIDCGSGFGARYIRGVLVWLLSGTSGATANGCTHRFSGRSAGVTLAPFLEPANQVVQQFVVRGEGHVDAVVGLADLGHPADALDAAQLLLYAAPQSLEVGFGLQWRDAGKCQRLAFVVAGALVFGIAIVSFVAKG